MSNGIVGRVLRLEQTLPSTGDQLALRTRMERARARCADLLPLAERARRSSPEFLADQADRQSRYDAKLAALNSAGRRATLAERLIAARELAA